MQRIGVHPSIGLLVRLQARAAIRRAWAKLRRPQFCLAALLAAALLGAWLAVALLSAQWRERADVDSLRNWMAATLTLYVAWHVLRTACFRPEYPLEQTEHVRRLLDSLPLRGRDRVAHQLSAIAGATVVKSGMVALLLAPDLPLPLCGWLGLALSLLAVELLRMLIEIGVWALPARGFVAYRVTTAIAFTAALAASAPTAHQALTQRLQALTHSAGPATAWEPTTALAAPSTFVGRTASLVDAAWSPLLGVALADRYDAASAWAAMSALVALTALALLTATGYEAALGATARRERRAFARSAPFRSASTQAASCGVGRTGRHYAPRVAPGLPRLRWAFAAAGPAGAVCWRQWQGARRHAWGVCVAFLPPAALALATIPTSGDAESAFLGVVCALAFYTFLLLPTALKFDFRRDLDRLGLLKSLPIGSPSLALAQLATPTLLASGFQGAVLLVTQVVRPVDPRLPIAAWALLGLLNLAVFALENWAFLKFPHRLQQEGLTVLLRTMLTFAAKGMLFAAGMAATLAWQAAALALAESLADRGVPLGYGWVFLVGALAGLAASIALLVHLIARALDRFDLSEHLPAA
jgi:hypothetical protein